MLSFDTLLLPVNFAERCGVSARYARYLADPAKTKIVLLHVLEDVPYEFASMEFSGVALHDLVVERRKQAEGQLREFAAKHLSGMNLEIALLEGDPATRIVGKAHEINASMILMPTHGYGRFRRFILGSTTAKVLHDADVPVWTGVHIPEVPDQHEIRHILCAIDLGSASERVAAWATDAAEKMNAKLTVIHVVPHLERVPGEYFERDWEVQVKQLVTVDLEKLFAGKPGEPTLLVEGGDPVDTICGAARSGPADLMVIGRGTASGIFGRMRAHAYEIIRESPCPVVSV